MTSYGLLDTSALIAWEHRAAGESSDLPDEFFVSVITLTELHVGVYAARDTDTRAKRMATLDSIAGFEVLAADADAAVEWSRLRYRLAEERRRINVNDLWIASIAVVHGLPVITQDDDFTVLEGLGGPDVIRI